MANYIEAATGRYPVSESQIKAENRQVSFPKQFRPPEGFELVFPAPAPTFGPITQYAREIAPKLVNGHYEQDYEVVELYPVQADKDAAIAAHLLTQKTTFILQVDTDTDALVKAVIGERASEYELAEKEATAFKAAGYSGTVPGSVAAWAAAKSWTAIQAADDIIATASGWRQAQLAIRTNRLTLKEAARVATDAAGLATVQAQWSGFMAAIRAQLGL